MSGFTRRRLMCGAGAMTVFPVTVAAQQGDPYELQKIDALADIATAHMIENYPATKDLVELAAGYLMIPEVTQGAFFFGAASGDGVLRIAGETVDYYQSLRVNFGFQVSASQFSQAVFFLNQDALIRFRQSNGWTFGAGMRVLVVEGPDMAGFDTLTRTNDVVGLTFADSGLHLGFALEGTKFVPLGS